MPYDLAKSWVERGFVVILLLSVNGKEQDMKSNVVQIIQTYAFFLGKVEG